MGHATYKTARVYHRVKGENFKNHFGKNKISFVSEEVQFRERKNLLMTVKEFYGLKFSLSSSLVRVVGDERPPQRDFYV